uniref:Uncharacterized protein n=1 Tax=Meloidogyne hapla TaxID=6305 RepID=A0A1I8BPH4_MELHA
MREPFNNNNNNEIPQNSSQQNNSKLINGFNNNNNNENNNCSNNCQNNAKSSCKESMDNQAKQTRRSLPAQQKSPYISNFWISTLKSRSSSETSSQRPLLGQNTTEKLHQLQQSPSSQSPSSLSSPSSSAITTINSEDQINNIFVNKNILENQNLGAVESVAVRTANFLMEMRRTQEGKKQSTKIISPFGYSGTCGRVTPFPSPLIEQQHISETTSSTSQLLLDSESLDNNNNIKQNCGPFPTIPSEQNKKQFQPLQVNIKEEIPTSSSLQQKQSSTPSPSSSIAELPQPAPKHHLREQLLKIKQKNVFAGNSFFGGISNNPFFFGNQKQQNKQENQKQRKLLPTAKQLLHSSSPNFPQTNIVISRVTELEERQQKHKNNNTAAKPVASSVQQSNNSSIVQSKISSQTNSTSNNSKIKSNNTRNDRLSPRSSLFRTKPVIVIDLGQEENKEVKRKEEIKENKNEEQKLKEENKKKLKNFEEQKTTTKNIQSKNLLLEKPQNIANSEIKEKSKSVTALVKQNVLPKHFQFNIQRREQGKM